MSTITVRLNNEEARIYKEYAKFKNTPLSTLMKEALEEKIEEEIDLKSILAYKRRDLRMRRQIIFSLRKWRRDWEFNEIKDPIWKKCR